MFVFVCLCLCHHGLLAVSGSVCHPNKGGFEHESDKDKKFKAFKITIKTQTNKARLRTSNFKKRFSGAKLCVSPPVYVYQATLHHSAYPPPS